MSSITSTNEFVTDTMGLILWFEHRKMPVNVKSLFQSAEEGQATIHIPTIVFAELLYLSEKGRIGVDLTTANTYLKQSPHFKEYPLNLAVIQAASEITDIPELHDRLIAATAYLLNLPLISNDPVIQTSTFVQTRWA